ncbi:MULTISPECIES: ABC transporter substrate-binding protein [unclassified Chelatococcus]|uniref:ABC transporter substrate-binding protein n=1 Tax=unclassified Chelatococcus TaxID=2638111 RepID=UPI001BD16815|nr:MULTISPECIES: ABC transporter substrate-binding protein [unclassified Chelatococcus]CAH1649720.1 ABC-type nitrate/sulfonate/bicarbonate transport system substrate-binding protein [Hyphomicrobiales bacterium]MBS7743405.1 ABC transporter substrate-binding protein [Chelatococcus sp. HY11]MBX3541477.1 ABC transporter substrate-binding protein [Chelatococcus sp.]MCO5074629.1 ABC transporter substrate-binding protein [Chelatococcus sp.]CAH1692148.1 ABC-type nitrate/sulfonate/bicarbonate transport
MPTRRIVLKGAALAAGMISAPAVLRAQGQDNITLLTPFAFGPNFIEMMNAVAGGYFKKEGLDVDLQAGRGGSQALQQLIAGKTALIRISSIEQMRAMAASPANLVCISTLYQSSTFHVVSPKDKPIRSAEDLKGKTVGLVSVGGSTEIFLDLMLHKVGIAPSEVKREVSGDTPAALQFVKAGRIDCFICSINVVVALREMGSPIEVWSTDRYAPMPGQGYTATREALDKNPDQFVRILRALKGSVDELITQPTGPIFDRAAKIFEIARLDNKQELAAIVKTSADELWLSQGRDNLMRNVPKLWAEGLATLRASDMSKETNPEVFYTNTYIDQALKG